jgi:hypothetical protein
MRTLMAAVLLAGCVGSGSAGGSRPAVMPMLSELPSDPTKRDAVLDSASKTAGPEHRKGLTAKERKAATAAATAAAILGSMFSSTQSVTIGTANQFDENQLIAPDAVPPVQPPPSDAPADASQPSQPAAASPDDLATSHRDLIPWIKLR